MNLTALKARFPLFFLIITLSFLVLLATTTGVYAFPELSEDGMTCQPCHDESFNLSAPADDGDEAVSGLDLDSLDSFFDEEPEEELDDGLRGIPLVISGFVFVIGVGAGQAVRNRSKDN